jgi:mRNA-degrading endonuclease RelE of RelBE toxin-antitoxin system
MTRYTVVWHADAQEQLADIWLRAHDRQLVTRSANVIDDFLGHEAASQGTMVHDDLRELVIGPLRVTFSVSEPDRMVRVVAVHHHDD